MRQGDLVQTIDCRRFSVEGQRLLCHRLQEQQAAQGRPCLCAVRQCWFLSGGGRRGVKKYLLTGLLVWVPLGITLWVLDLTISTLDQSLLLLPENWHPNKLLGVHIPGLGVILTAVIVIGTGLLTRNVFGQRLLRYWDGLLHRIPFVNAVYKSVKQVSDTLLSSNGQAFRKVLLVR